MFNLCERWESNPQSPEPQSGALTNISYNHHVKNHLSISSGILFTRKQSSTDDEFTMSFVYDNTSTINTTASTVYNIMTLFKITKVLYYYIIVYLQASDLCFSYSLIYFRFLGLVFQPH